MTEPISQNGAPIYREADRDGGRAYEGPNHRDGGVRVSLDGHRQEYQPGEVLSGEYQVTVPWVGTGAEPADFDSVELSVLWYTEGTGDEDFKVHFFERFSAEATPESEWFGLRRFSTKLPNSPLSYEGLIVKVRWCVRARAFFQRGKAALSECPFRLGSVPAPVAPEPATAAVGPP